MFSLLSVTLSALLLPGPQHSSDSYRQELAGAGDRASMMPKSSPAGPPPVALFFGGGAQQGFRNVFLCIFSPHPKSEEST